ncbi:MAG: hypothetical protein WED10_15150 [Brumimicrobium sp.]
MNEKELTQEESLKVIQGMINIAKNKINETGFHFLLWGVLVVLASLTQYLLIHQGFGNETNWIWAIMPIIGVPIAVIHEYRKSKSEQIKSKFDTIYGFLWLGFGVALIATIFISISLNTSPVAFILVIAGLATFMSGIIYHFTPLIVGAVFLWIGGLLCPYVETIDVLLVNAGSITMGYIIPGIILSRRAKIDKDV